MKGQTLNASIPDNDELTSTTILNITISDGEKFVYLKSEHNTHKDIETPNIVYAIIT